MVWNRPLGVLVPLCMLYCGQGAYSENLAVLSKSCRREERQGHFAVSCYQLGRGSGWDCHPMNLRKTSLRELRTATRLRNLPPGCLKDLSSELHRRHYLQAVEPERPKLSLSDLLMAAPPRDWQEN